MRDVYLRPPILTLSAHCTPVFNVILHKQKQTGSLISREDRMLI